MVTGPELSLVSIMMDVFYLDLDFSLLYSSLRCIRQTRSCQPSAFLGMEAPLFDPLFMAHVGSPPKIRVPEHF